MLIALDGYRKFLADELLLKEVEWVEHAYEKNDDPFNFDEHFFEHEVHEIHLSQIPSVRLFLGTVG